VPQLDTPLLGDLLLGLIVLLFVPFGIRRGVAKEAMVTAGLLFGWALAAAWLDPAAAWLTRVWGLEPATARFVVLVGGYGGGMLLLGYGGGAALGRVRPGVLARLAGGLLAAGNGVLLLVLLLGAIDQELEPGGWLDDGLVARSLLRDDAWVLLGLGAVFLLCVLIGLVVTAFRRGRERPFGGPVAGDPGSSTAVPPRQRPVRLGRSADVGKYEPTSEPGSGRFGAGLGQTAPLSSATRLHPSPPAPASDEVWSRGSDRRADAANGHAPTQAQGATAPISDDWLRRPARHERAQPAEATGDSGSTAGRRCPRCGAPARSTDVFCPECGQTL